MDSEILYQEYKQLEERTIELYKKYTEKQKKPIKFDREDECDFLVDYLDHSAGIYYEASLVSLKKDRIVIFDRELGQKVHIDFTDLMILDKIQILEIYERGK